MSKTADVDTGPRTLLEAVRFFSHPETCVSFLVAMRWPDGEVKCPTCGSGAVVYLKNARVWKCKGDHPRQKFSIKIGTVMEDSPIPLQKWLPAIWMAVNCKNGVSSYEMHRALGVTQKTAWFMLQRIRLAMQGEDGGKLGGEVEADETYIGGKARNMRRGRWTELRRQRALGRTNAGRAVVLGMLERGGKVRARVVPNVQKPTLHKHVTANVERGATLYTDQLMSYTGLGADYEHNVINHAVEYVSGNVHTNGIENFWALLKRAIRGTYVSVEPFHLFRYLDEQAFRFNERKETDGGRFIKAVLGIVGKRLTYNGLIGAELSPAAT